MGREYNYLIKIKMLLTDGTKIIRDDLLTFIVYRKDLKKAWHIAGDIVYGK